MKPIRLSDITKADYERIVRRSKGRDSDILPSVQDTMSQIRTYGDAAIYKKYRTRYGESAYGSIRVSQNEIADAYRSVKPELIAALRQMQKNITAVQGAQLTRVKDTEVRPEKGIRVWREWRAIEKVGLYVPGGKAI